MPPHVHARSRALFLLATVIPIVAVLACGSSSSGDAPIEATTAEAGTDAEASSVDAGPVTGCVFVTTTSLACTCAAFPTGHVECAPELFGGAGICRADNCDCACTPYTCQDGYVNGPGCTCDAFISGKSDAGAVATCSAPDGGTCCFHAEYDSCDCAPTRKSCSSGSKVPSCNLSDVRKLLAARRPGPDGYGDEVLVPSCVDKKGNDPTAPKCQNTAPSGGSGSSSGGAGGCSSETCSGSMGGDGFYCTFFCKDGQCTKQCS